ncbi:hypothetical protein [Bradyrhizobium neotropicale]|uniref:hypothetical protein n=1 Tax=Bradyrhizobium neotropicale TaxID=1497615 RepID=UPI001AD76BF5|nr:hypothetical protein [Bradyrhizobium neotropicale]MBO4228087.1 hypothetical protein [Bradyrhizobium neotropicale]
MNNSAYYRTKVEDCRAQAERAGRSTKSRGSASPMNGKSSQNTPKDSKSNKSSADAPLGSLFSNPAQIDR